MKFMNLNKWRLCNEADGEGSDLGGGDNKETPTDNEEQDVEKDDIKLGDDEAKDDIKLGDDDKDDKDGDSANDAPESYAEFDMPEGVEVDQALLDEALPVFKELNLTQEQAQKLVDLQAKSVQDATNAMSQQHVDTVNQWKTDLHADKDIGGDKLNESLSNAKLFLKTHGSNELTKYLDETGLSNNPLLLKAFSKSGSLLREDNPGNENQNQGENGLSAEDARLNRLYPTKQD